MTDSPNDKGQLRFDTVLPTNQTCVVCGDPLGGEPWWVVAYPKGVHSRCRDWSREPFPFAAQLRLLRKLWQQAPEGEARDAIAYVGRQLGELDRRWPDGGHDAVVAGTTLLQQARAILAEYVDSSRLRKL